MLNDSNEVNIRVYTASDGIAHGIHRVNWTLKSLRTAMVNGIPWLWLSWLSWLSCHQPLCPSTKYSILNRKMIFQSICLGFHVKIGGCIPTNCNMVGFVFLTWVFSAPSPQDCPDCSWEWECRDKGHQQNKQKRSETSSENEQQE